jgi:sigma-54 dependent transcriptional regulator, acetoin dehydrogenase operon transcriptional activator AcoR
VLPTRAVTAYRPEAIWQARRAFFDQGGGGVEGLDAAVLRSWERCVGKGRRADDPVEFQPVASSALSELVEGNRALVQCARPELTSLAESVRDAGYAVLLTDLEGRVLAVDGAIAQHSTPLRQAFRAGVDLSEPAIGTTAMSVAMSESRAVRVLGAEHYLEETQIFHCCAAPVFDVQGEVIGAVDVSHDMPGMQHSALWLAERCAQRIERRLFLELPASMRLEIDVGDGNPSGGSTHAWLALGRDGELLAASREARQLMELPARLKGLQFDFLFENRFASWASQLKRRGTDGLALQLHSGVRLRVRPLEGAAVSSARSAQRPSVRSSSTSLAGPRPCFGDDRMEREFSRALRAFDSDLPVLLAGETGSGKEVAARALHAQSACRSGPFLALNCAAIPAELLASELFGHEDGAFTGSRRGGAAGKIESAQGGTLFLDEIGDMPPGLQAALLRVLDSKEVTRLGASASRVVDVRFVCATHRDLQEMVSAGTFRADLFYRIAGHVFELLPLRERNRFDALLDTLLVELGADPARITADTRSALRSHAWPGNVRQLMHGLRRALALAEEDEPLGPEHLEFLQTAAVSRTSDRTSSDLMRRVQADAIAQAMRQARGNVSEAARMLGIARATLYRKLAQLRQAGAGQAARN